MPFRVSFFITQQSSLLGGWSENWWNTSSQLSSVQAAAEQLIPLILYCKGNQAYCPSYRISDTALKRQVSLKRRTGAGPANFPGDDCDLQNTAVLLKIKAAGVSVTNQWFRGLADADITMGGFWTPRNATITGFNKLFAALSAGANGWAVKKINPANPLKDITAVTQAGQVTCPGHAFSTGDTIRIQRAKGTFDINQLWKITVIDTNNFALVGFQTPTPAAVYLGGGVAQFQGVTYVGISSVSIDRTTTHKTGRPFGQLSGRRRTRKK